MPSKIRAFHLCTGSGKSVISDVVLPVLKQMAGIELRLRCNLHSGSDNEILDHFEDFGLVDVHMRTFSGRALENAATNLEWIRERLAFEQERENEPQLIIR